MRWNSCLRSRMRANTPRNKTAHARRPTSMIKIYSSSRRYYNLLTALRFRNYGTQPQTDAQNSLEEIFSGNGLLNLIMPNVTMHSPPCKIQFNQTVPHWNIIQDSAISEAPSRIITRKTGRWSIGYCLLDTFDASQRLRISKQWKTSVWRSRNMGMIVVPTM